MLVREVLAAKGGDVWTISAAKTLQDALRLFISKKIGALLVVKSPGQISGIVSERDVLRTCYDHPADWFKLRISDVMTGVIKTVAPEADLKVVMELMTENRIRHVPVVANQKLVGIISIGDVVKARLEHTEYENEHMRNYIYGV